MATDYLFIEFEDGTHWYVELEPLRRRSLRGCGEGGAHAVEATLAGLAELCRESVPRDMGIIRLTDAAFQEILDGHARVLLTPAGNGLVPCLWAPPAD